MHPTLVSIILACLIGSCLGAVSSKPFNYDSAWKEIDKLQRDGLPKSMAGKVDSLYAAAVRENKADQQVRALVYQLAILQDVEEFSDQLAIDKVRSQLDRAPFPASAILHSMLAQLYWNYYQSNRWRFGQRSETVQFQQDDIATWDLATISKESIKEYRLSLERPLDLQKYSIADYPAMLSSGGSDERLLRPTLYDFLAHLALDFYVNDESGLTRPFEEFQITDTQYFAPAASYAKMRIASPDTLSLKYQAALLYQDLLRFHLNDKDPSALVEVDLDRLQFVYDNCSIANPARDYEAALRLVQSQYAAYPASSSATFKLASLIKSQGDLYKPDLAEEHRWDYKNALEICQSAIKAYPGSYGAISCQVLASGITQPELALTTEQYALPQTPIKALLGVKNLSRVKLSIYRIPQTNIEKNENYDSEENWWRDDFKKVRALLKKSPAWSRTYQVANEGDFRLHSYELPLTSLPLGNYILIAANEEDGDYAARACLGFSLFSSTQISYITPQGQSGVFLVANRKTGLPIFGATVNAYKSVYDREARKSRYVLNWSGKTNSEGKVRIPAEDSYDSRRYQITSGSDTLQIFNYYNYGSGSGKYTQNICLMFTDRSIYRPGQTIYLKGVLYATDSEKYYELKPNADLDITFRDVNGQTVATQKVRTNEYATFNTTFTAPKGVLTGNMTISAGYITVQGQSENSYSRSKVQGSVSFSVEEYKRPRFEVQLDAPAETFKLNQYVTVEGTALSYAGFPIDSASVAYRITRQPKYPFWFWWWGPSPSTPQKEIAHGTAQTDASGKFSLTFLATADESALPWYNPYFTFTLSADVTDISGETRSGKLDLNIGEKDLLLNPILAEKIDLQGKQLAIPIQTTNLSGKPVPAQGTVTISRLETPNHVQKQRLWNAPDRNYLERDDFLRQFPHDAYANEDKITSWKVLESLWKGSFDTPEKDSLLIKDFARWKPGDYALEAVANYQQQEIKVTRYFTVYDSAAKQLPYPLADWFVPVKTVCEPGETAQILIGSGYGGVSVLYEVEKDHVIVDSLRFTLDDKQRLFELPVKESDRGSFYVHFTFIRDGRLYTHSQEITVPWTNKQIAFEYMTFRDKLLPGQNEGWRLKLKDHTGGKVTAEVLASMYDASLDAFRSNQWSASVYGKVPRSRGWLNYNFAPIASLYQIDVPGYAGYYPERRFDAFNWYGYYSGYYGGRYLMSDAMALPVMMAKESAGSSRQIEMNSLPGSAMSDTADIISLQAGVNNLGGELQAQPEDLSGVQARANFAETAFFYPELRTDENGEVSLAFTVPEALTRWKFRALAITRDFQIGTTENSTVTQKPLMVLPNAPRFFREGDKITFTAKITSLDETDQSGNCQLFLFDAISMEPVDRDFGLKQAQQPFSVKKGESTSLSWVLDVPYGLGAVTYRVVARAGDFSDGEENTLPILTNRMLVTESLPLPVRGHSTKSFTWAKLRDSESSDTIRNHKLTLEYTSNPAWYAVQALPYMMEYPYDCNEQIFSRFYANSLASHIANANPRVRRVFDSWRDTPNSAALLSNLEKNQELKAVLLQETPWVLDAKDESQAKQRIGLLFDLNHMADQFNAALTQLQKNQSPSGAWPWFPGMPDSWWVTQYIVEGFGHLDHLGVTSVRSDSRIWRMVESAVEYIDEEILRDYENIKKYGHLDDDHLGYMEMHYLYARSYFPDLEIPEDVGVAVDYFLSQADKYWLDKDLYGQGLIALALHRSEKRVTPGKIIASLKEKALHSEELGMWWKNDDWGWFWYQAPIETQSLLIEAFHDIAADTLSIDEMRTWLLKNKQTTNWKTTKATAEACYALLISGTEWLNTEQLAQITLAGKAIDPLNLDGVQVEAGTGYFKTSWSGGEITPQMANISVTNPNDVSSWGALYWQYFEDLDKITPAETPLRLNKKLFVERITDTGKVLEPVSDKSQLAVGDKVVVRIELRSDRDMEYVHLKDMCSAGFEPINVLSRYKWQDGLGYYEATGDAATNFFIEYLRKGTYVFEYPLRVFNAGDFSNGVTSIQCMYAPEFSAHSEGIRVLVK